MKKRCFVAVLMLMCAGAAGCGGQVPGGERTQNEIPAGGSAAGQGSSNGESSGAGQGSSNGESGDAGQGSSNGESGGAGQESSDGESVGAGQESSNRESGDAGQGSSNGSSAGTGQGKTDKNPKDAGQTGYYDVFVDTEWMFQWEEGMAGPSLEDKRNVLLGMQFYQDSPVQLWSEMTSFAQWDLCLYREDGSREVLMPIEYGYKGGYLDQEGNVYLWTNYIPYTRPDGTGEKRMASLKKYLSSGDLLFEEELAEGQDVLKIRQTAEGRLYAGIHLRSTGEKWIRELDPATGALAEPLGKEPAADMNSDLLLGVSGEDPAAFFGREFTEFGRDDGARKSVLSLSGTTYVSPRYGNEMYLVHDFRILEDESVEVLWVSRDLGRSLRETLRLGEVEKTLVTLNTWVADTWLSTQISLFNRSNEKYQVVLDTGSGTHEDYARLASIQIASGKGPDLISGDLIGEYLPGLMEKGALEDLRPCLERSGIREEAYFPFTFASWREGEKIYGVSPQSPSLAGYCMDSALLGGTTEPDIGQLVDALLAGTQEAAFLEGVDSQELLKLLLRGSDTLWGMVDWEAGSCDFGGELFAGILEAAKRYGDREGGGEKTYLAQARRFDDVFHFDELAERTRDGKVVCGVLFDDGCRAAVTSWNTLAVNAASPNKEGAWEFIAYLLGEEAQSATYTFPAGREAFDVWVERDRKEVADGRVIHEMYRGDRLPDGTWEIIKELSFSEEDITDEIVAEFVQTLEEARPYPLHTIPILEIIGQEASDYFTGSKSAAQVGEIVSNRVQLYLNEGR